VRVAAGGHCDGVCGGPYGRRGGCRAPQMRPDLAAAPVGPFAATRPSVPGPSRSRHLHAVGCCCHERSLSCPCSPHHWLWCRRVEYATGGCWPVNTVSPAAVSPVPRLVDSRRRRLPRCTQAPAAEGACGRFRPFCLPWSGKSSHRWDRVNLGQVVGARAGGDAVGVSDHMVPGAVLPARAEHGPVSGLWRARGVRAVDRCSGPGEAGHSVRDW
jgi:hypothetical protein